MFTNLEAERISQKDTLQKMNFEKEKITELSFMISYMIAKASKPHSEGEFVKMCLVEASNLLMPGMKKTIEGLSLSRNTITRRINDMATDVENP